MITRDGRVLVSPKSALGVDDFQRLYMGEGRTPAEAQSFIHLNYPTEAKSVLDDRWKQLGIAESPERYFANPANLMDLTEGTQTAVARTQAARRPLLPSPSGTGMVPSNMRGQWNNPALPAAARLALLGIEEKERQAETFLNGAEGGMIRRDAATLMPIASPGATDADMLASQLAGDTTGLSKKLLIRNSGLSPESYVEAASRGQAPELKPFSPRTGYGNVGSSSPMRLDEKIFYDRDFQQVLNRDPEAAKHVYQRLTGRSLEVDMKDMTDARESQKKIGREFAATQLKAGAQLDPVTGKWKVWRTEEAPESALTMMGGSIKPFRQLVDADDVQSKWMNENFEYLTGGALPLRKDSPKGAEVRQATLQRLQNDTVFQTKKAGLETQLKRTLTPEELVDLANRHTINEGQLSATPGPYEKGAMFTKEVVNRLLGIPEEAAVQILENFGGDTRRKALETRDAMQADPFGIRRAGSVMSTY